MDPTTSAATRRPAMLVTLLCWAIVVFDGYDLIVYGTVLPHLLKEPGWHLSKSGAGLLGVPAGIAGLAADPWPRCGGRGARDAVRDPRHGRHEAGKRCSPAAAAVPAAAALRAGHGAVLAGHCRDPVRVVRPGHVA